MTAGLRPLSKHAISFLLSNSKILTIVPSSGDAAQYLPSTEIVLHVIFPFISPFLSNGVLPSAYPSMLSPNPSATNRCESPEMDICLGNVLTLIFCKNLKLFVLNMYIPSFVPTTKRSRVTLRLAMAHLNRIPYILVTSRTLQNTIWSCGNSGKSPPPTRATQSDVPSDSTILIPRPKSVQ